MTLWCTFGEVVSALGVVVSIVLVAKAWHALPDRVITSSEYGDEEYCKAGIAIWPTVGFVFWVACTYISIHWTDHDRLPMVVIKSVFVWLLTLATWEAIQDNLPKKKWGYARWILPLL